MLCKMADLGWPANTTASPSTARIWPPSSRCMIKCRLHTWRKNYTFTAWSYMCCCRLNTLMLQFIQDGLTKTIRFSNPDVTPKTKDVTTQLNALNEYILIIILLLPLKPQKFFSAFFATALDAS